MPHHADRAPAAAVAKHVAQNAINAQWADQGVEAFGVGNGIATGPVAAALLWSQEPIEYTVVGDTVNLTQRLQQWASPGEMLIGAPTYPAVDGPPAVVELDPALVKGRETPVTVCGFPERVS
jgi:class 3 adenylate cyclase